MEILIAETPEVATTLLQAEMERFGKDKNQLAKVAPFAWDNIWRELVNVGIYRRGPDIAEIGSTWLDGMVAMQSLNPFSMRDVYQIGGKEIFLPAAWQNVGLTNQNDVWGIPFRADARVIFYWKDQFEKAAVDPVKTFSSIDQIAVSFAAMQEAGVAAWIAPTNSAHNTVYNIASWIWGAGGDFLSRDGKRTAFNSPTAKHGIDAYFDLLRFLPKQTSPFSDHDALQLFFARKAASMVAGPWLLNSLRLRSDAADLLPHLGIALLPGPAFVGGTLLVTWKHSKYLFEPIDLIRRLTSVEFQSEYCQISGLLPVRQDLWTDEFIHSDEYLPVFHQAICAGRGLHPTPLWGIVEDHLSNALGAIWRDLYDMNMPGKKIDTLAEITAKRLDTLAVSLDMTLSTTNEPRNDDDDDDEPFFAR
jgi:multiple sugar transport system substrate-binding protein